MSDRTAGDARGGSSEHESPRQPAALVDRRDPSSLGGSPLVTGSIRGATAEQLVLALGLEPHPEGGYFKETYRQRDVTGRGASTAIYFLLAEGQESGWHRVDATEVWHHYAGAPLTLATKKPGAAVVTRTLGPELLMGQLPQLVVEAFEWQAARSTGAWSLVGCTVAPAFEFTGFELAPPGQRSAFSGELPPEAPTFG